MDHEGATYKTLRDEIAIAAMQADMSRNDGIWANNTGEIAAQTFYEWADFMLKAREAE